MKHLSLNAKIASIISMLFLGSILIAYLGLSRMAFINDLLVEITTVHVKRDQLTSQILDAQRRSTILNKDIIIETSAERMETLEKERKAVSAERDKYIKEYGDIASPEEKVILEKVVASFGKLSEINGRIRGFARANNFEAASRLTSEEEAPARAEVTKYINEIYVLTMERVNQAAAEAMGAYHSARNLVVMMTILSLTTGLLLSIIVMRAVSKAIDGVIASLNDNSAQVTTAAQQIASSSEELSQAATEQASSLEETASAVEELSSMIQRNAQGAKKSVEIAGDSASKAERGERVVEEMMTAMSEINSANNEIMAQITDSNQKISEIAKVISEIGNKTKVINDIVFQTKLLSFNASVEAARAGEHGKGFAVVAEEVGNLAQMSGNAAKEISQMLEGSTQRVEGIVAETKTKVEALITKGKAKVDLGTKVAEQCRAVLDEILNGVNTVSGTVREISTASDEQARGVGEISKAMTQLDQVTQQNAAVSEEAASAAEELSAQAEALRQVVQVLITTIKGGEAKAPAPLSATMHEDHARRPRASAAPSKPGKLIPITAKKAKVSTSPSQHAKMSVKRAVGSDVVPAEDDPRFEEV